jgi:hypothetical protein
MKKHQEIMNLVKSERQNYIHSREEAKVKKSKVLNK